MSPPPSGNDLDQRGSHETLGCLPRAMSAFWATVRPDVDGPAMYPRSTKRKCHSSRRLSTVECRLESDRSTRQLEKSCSLLGLHSENCPEECTRDVAGWHIASFRCYAAARRLSGAGIADAGAASARQIHGFMGLDASAAACAKASRRPETASPGEAPGVAKSRSMTTSITSLAPAGRPPRLPPPPPPSPYPPPARAAR